MAHLREAMIFPLNQKKYIGVCMTRRSSSLDELRKKNMNGPNKRRKNEGTIPFLSPQRPWRNWPLTRKKTICSIRICTWGLIERRWEKRGHVLDLISRPTHVSGKLFIRVPCLATTLFASSVRTRKMSEFPSRGDSALPRPENVFCSTYGWLVYPSVPL